MKKFLIPASFFALPFVASAQVNNLNDVLTFILNFLNALIPILIAAAVVYFLYGLIRYVVADESGREEARQIIVYGIVVLTVMIAVWGLVNILVNTFGIGTTAAPTGPSVPTARPVTTR